MPLSADARLTLLRIKIERAKHHFLHLEGEAVGARGNELNVPLSDYQAETGKLFIYDKTVPVLPFHLLAIAGDVVHNLRTALDHLAYQLALVGTPDKIPSRLVEFPIAKDWSAYEKGKKTGKVEGIRPTAVKAIDDLKPYKDGNEVLWRIHELDNIDKHRFVFVIAKDALFEAPWYGFDQPYLIRPRTVKADAPQFSGVFESEVENDVDFEIAKAASETQISKGNALVPTLRKWVNYVEGLIIGFRPHLE